MLGITDLWTYVFGTVAIILLPGPNSLYTLSTAARRGVRAGYQAALGVFLGDAVLMFGSAVGVASLLYAYPPLFLLIRYAGGAYLLWVGFGLVRAAVRRWRSPQTSAEPVADTGHPFRRALLISLLNPKAILFFVSFFIQFVDPSYPHPALSFLVLALIAEVVSALYLTALIFGGSSLAARFRRHPRLAAGAGTGVGALFMGFGIRLATASFG